MHTSTAWSSARSDETPSVELLAAASERRVARIGFDLHDGPIQTLAALIGDARMFGSQLEQALDRDARTPLILGRLDDLKTRMVALEFELRSLCHSLEAPTVLRVPFERVLEEEVVSFRRSTGANLTVRVLGSFTDLTPSQRIALLRVIQEALRNVREHAGAANVDLRITRDDEGTRATVADDGPGFDVEEALACAVRDGRVGLMGMMERVRLLGGTCEIESRPGGPTTISAFVPAWRPPEPARP